MQTYVYIYILHVDIIPLNPAFMLCTFVEV